MGDDMKDKINELREKLHHEIELDNKEKILELSQELDELILEYFKKNKSYIVESM